MKYLKTSEIAKAVNIHPNTVRLYEKWGMLPPVQRSPKGYRLFNENHLEQVRLIRIVLKCTLLGGEIRRTAYKVIHLAAVGELEESLNEANICLKMVQAEQRRAEKAAEVLESWIMHSTVDISTDRFLNISEIARLLDVTPDMLRNWERNRLIITPRNPDNGYRLYGRKEIDRLRVIRALRHARYSNMSILRMMNYLDQGLREDPRRILNTPEPDEDIVGATDRWLLALAEIGQHVQEMIAQVQMMLRKKNATL